MREKMSHRIIQLLWKEGKAVVMFAGTYKKPPAGNDKKCFKMAEKNGWKDAKIKHFLFLIFPTFH